MINIPYHAHRFEQALGAASRQMIVMQAALAAHAGHLNAHAHETAARLTQDGARLLQDALPFDADAVGGSSGVAMQGMGSAYADYARDAAERMILSLDVLRQRGDMFFEYEANGAPPVLIYDYDVVVDGADLPRPCNYMLLKVTPPDGVETFDWKRPYVIIDPRAGHGAGIGGFKPDSQVGVALSDGHPVYFVAFRPKPEPTQTLADVTHAEATFLRKIRDLHPDAPKPIVVGNCQGGWATAILAATHPDLAGPIVLNGAPMSYWSGRIGQDPMRYSGGMVGGVTPALLMADLGGGSFDGAHLVLNFETLNPGRTWFRKYFDLYDQVDTGAQRFLDFEKWWSGFFLMNEAEIRWIVENLFVGNRLGKGEAQLETGLPIDLKAIRAPIIVFASHGDNITPPQQALNWIVDTYADAHEIEIRGQRILYMVHEEVGHLGIFVSSSIAKREHTQMASTVKTIEALPPGLYEMKIEDVVGRHLDKQFTVSFHKRDIADILALSSGRQEESAFAAVARMSEDLAEGYDTLIRPAVRATVSAPMAEVARHMHPLRAQRAILSSRNLLTSQFAGAAETVRDNRTAVARDNPFRVAERLWADMVQASWDWIALNRAMWSELSFLTIYASPWAQAYAKTHAHQRARKSHGQLRLLPEVLLALDNMRHGGLGAAVVRMLVLLAESRGNVRRDRLERSAALLSTEAPFAAMDTATRARMIHEQTIVAEFEPEAALQSLVDLLPKAEDRKTAMDMVAFVVGDVAEMEPRTVALISRMRDVLGLGPLKISDAAE